MRRVVPLLAALALLGGCSQTTDGTATPGGADATTGGQTAESGRPTSKQSTAEQPAKRPKTIDIAAIDPCTLLTEAQRAEFGLDRPPQRDDVPGNPSCGVSREDRKYSVGVFLDTTKGIGTFTDQPRDDVTKLQVGGFPAAMVESTTSLGLACSVYIDVSDGQVANVQAHSLGDTDVKSLCRIVQPIAGAVVANLMNA